MLVLFLAVASVLVFVTVLLLLWIADRLESRERRRKQCPLRPVVLISVDQAFDPVFAVLWEAPILALQRIESAGREVEIVRLYPIFSRAAKRFPEIYDGFRFLQWLQALEDAQLIAWHGQKVALTEEGHAFLQYHFVRNPVVQAY
jgi:hypothetical protein